MGHIVTWNGPICGICGARYLGSHTCSREDLMEAIGRLQDLLDEPPVYKKGWSKDFDMSGCPCRTENGGSGVCGCILGGPSITC